MRSRPTALADSWSSATTSPSHSPSAPGERTDGCTKSILPCDRDTDAVGMPLFYLLRPLSSV